MPPPNITASGQRSFTMSNLDVQSSTMHKNRQNVSNAYIELLQEQMDQEMDLYNTRGVAGPSSVDILARVLNGQHRILKGEVQRIVYSQKSVIQYVIALLPWGFSDTFPETQRREREQLVARLIGHKTTIRQSGDNRASFFGRDLYGPAYDPDAVGALRPHDNFEMEMRNLCKDDDFIGTEWPSWYNMSTEALPTCAKALAESNDHDVLRHTEKIIHRNPNTYERLIGKLARRVIFLFDLSERLPAGDHKDMMIDIIYKCKEFVIFITSSLKSEKQHSHWQDNDHDKFVRQLRQGFSTLFHVFISLENALRKVNRTTQDEDNLLVQVKKRASEVGKLMTNQSNLETAQHANIPEISPELNAQLDDGLFETEVKKTLSAIPYEGATNFETITEKRNAEIAVRAREEKIDLASGELVSELDALQIRRVDLLQAEAVAEQIGFGSSAKVYSYEISKTKHTVAVKDMKSSKHTARKLLLHEARIWCKLRHSHILELDGFAHLGSMENVVLVSKLCPFGDLRDYINEKYPSKRQKTRLLWQAADAVKYLHNIGIIHGDLRGRNVLVDHNRDAQLCDFGCAKEKYNGSSLHNGSKLSQKRWMAYELLEQSTPAPLGEVTEEQDYYGVNESTDIYAFGCLTLEGITGEDPYVGVDDDDLLEMKQAKLCPKRPDHSDIDQDLWDLMKKCWNANPHDRGSAADIYEVLKNGWPSQRRERPESQ